MKPDLKAPWRAYVAKHGLKVSKIREEVVEAFLELEGHIDLEQLHAQVKRHNPGISLATVYRVVKLMEQAGLAQARHFTPGAASYERVVGRGHHDHLICERCGVIVEFADPEIERIQEELALAYGFVVVNHRHELYGLCRDCRTEGETPTRA